MTFINNPLNDPWHNPHPVSPWSHITKKPVHASLSFLLTLLTLAVIYLQLSAQFISVMQILFMPAPSLCCFMFVIILFQDAHEQIEQYKPQSAVWLIFWCHHDFFTDTAFLGHTVAGLPPSKASLPEGIWNGAVVGKSPLCRLLLPL